MPIFTIDIDTSELEDTLAFVRSRLTDKQMETVMRRVFRRTGKHVRTIVKRDIPKHYEVTAGAVSSETRAPQIASMSCKVPIVGPRRTIGVQFKAKGQARGWESLHKKYKVQAKIIKGTWTTTEGNNFRNIPSSLGKQAFQRFGRRLPIKKTLGPAIPEMANHLAEPDIQKDVLELMEKRVMQEMRFILSR